MLSMLRDVRSVDFYSRPQKGRCGKTNRLALTMLTLIMICSVAQGNPKCLGIGDAASEKKCRSIEGKEACLESEVVSDKNYTATCVWHDNQKYSVIDIQKVSSRGFPLGVVGLNYRGSLCGLRMTVDLPKEAKSKWGVNTRLWGGPSNVREWYSLPNPDIPMSSGACTASKGAPLSCSAEIIAPKGYALDPNFVENTATLDFFTSDNKRIAEFSKNGVLASDQALKLTTTYEYLKCNVKGQKDPKGPMISDSVWFGITSYQMYNNFDKGYFDLSYRTYKISKAKRVRWDFNVTRTIGKNPPTKLVTFLMRESDYQKWSSECIKCYAPTDLAIKNTLCEGISCYVDKKYLGWRNGEYRVFVGYPEVCNAFNDLCYNDRTPSTLKNGYTKELVDININPSLKLPEPSSSRLVVSGLNARGSYDDEGDYIINTGVVVRM